MGLRLRAGCILLLAAAGTCVVILMRMLRLAVNGAVAVSIRRLRAAAGTYALAGAGAARIGMRAALRTCAAAPGAVAMGFDFVAADELFPAAVAAGAIEGVRVRRLAVPRAKV